MRKLTLPSSRRMSVIKTGRPCTIKENDFPINFSQSRDSRPKAVKEACPCTICFKWNITVKAYAIANKVVIDLC